MRIRSSSLVLFALTLVAACADTSALTPQGAQVRYSTEALDASCHPLAEVHTDAASTSGTLGEEYLKEEREAARNRLRNTTARVGGNAVFVDEKAHPHISVGTAYKCTND